MATTQRIEHKINEGDVKNYGLNQNSVKRLEKNDKPRRSVSSLMSLASEENKMVSNNFHTINKSVAHEINLAQAFTRKIQELRTVLDLNIKGCDAKWLLFVSAALSYRYDAKLKPFPPNYLKVGNKYDIDSLVNVIKDTPTLRLLLQNIQQKDYDDLKIDVLELLHWVLVEIKEPIMRLISHKETKKLVRSIDCKAKFEGTVNMFEINAQSGPHSDLVFQRLAANRPVRLAFFGCKLDTFFALLHNGFHLYFSDNKSIELSTNLQTSLQNSPVGAGWGASQCGSMLSCTALCEVALNMDYVNIKGNSIDNKSEDFQIMSPDYIRIRYIILYGPQLTTEKGNALTGFFTIFRRYKQCVSLGVYVLIFISIGVFNHSKASTLRAYISDNIHSALNFCTRIILPNK